MVHRESPFIYEDAVPPDRFFDRKHELDFLIQNLKVKKKMLLCIVAPLKYGKTSLMLKYYDILQGIRGVVPVYVNLKKIDMPIMFIVEELKKWGIDLINAYEEAKKLGRLQKLFEKIDKALRKKELWLFLLIDEFHLLPEIVRSEGFYRDIQDNNIIFGFFRGFVEGARISYIVCGSVIEPLMDALDVWGGRFQILYLGPFSKEDAVDMLKKLFAEGGMSISDEDAEFISEAAGYHPFYMQYLGHQIYVAGVINKTVIMKSKQKLYEYLAPIFGAYLEKIRELGIDHLETLRKILYDESLTIDDVIRASRLLRMGIIKPKNAKYEFIDPLFKRYLESIFMAGSPVEILVVGHWAERIVGNYLVRKGYTPYYAHNSRGAFDIYVRIGNIDVGIQVKYTTSGEIYLSRREAENILAEANKLGWIPILAIVSKQVKFFSRIEPRKYSIDEGYSDIEQAINSINRI